MLNFLVLTVTKLNTVIILDIQPDIQNALILKYLNLWIDESTRWVCTRRSYGCFHPRRKIDVTKDDPTQLPVVLEVKVLIRDD
jgi:hypothetical protein